jgi:hypothetical protein
MHVMLIALAAAAQLWYEAKVATFGCSSSSEVAQLQQMRSDRTAFQTRLLERVFAGECITIGLGAVVEGAVETDAILRIRARIDPPGYMVPAADFKAKAPAAPEKK